MARAIHFLSNASAINKSAFSNVDAALLSSDVYFDMPLQVRSALVRDLALSRCQFFAVYGSQSELLHDVIDEELSALASDGMLLPGDFGKIATTWHDDDLPEQLAEFFLMHIGLSNLSRDVVCLIDCEDDYGRILKAYLQGK